MFGGVGLRWLAPSALNLDSDRLRHTLDELHAAVARPVQLTLPAADAALLRDRERIRGSLVEVLEHLGRIDLDARTALAGHLPQIRQDGADRLARVLIELQASLRRRFLHVMGDSKVAVLRDYLTRAVPDLLGVLNKSNEENAHSDIVSWLLSPRRAPNVAPAALSALASYLDDPDQWRAVIREAIARDSLSVRREFTIGREWTNAEGLDRIDIVVTGPGFLLAIENKIWAVEHDRQTATYWAWLSHLRLRTAGVFLTPSGMAAAAPEFRPVSYLDLLACLLDAPVRGTISPEEEYVLVAYVKTLMRAILRPESRSAKEPEGRA